MASAHDTATPTMLQPPSVRLPKIVQGVLLTVSRRATTRRWTKRYGRIFAFNVPYFGHGVVVSDPVLAKAVWTADPDLLTNYQPNLSNFFGAGSIFAVDGARHRDRRRLLAPSLHGRSLREHEAMIVDAVFRETSNWPNRTEFRTLEPMKRIALNVILQAIFGVDGGELDDLRSIVPRYADVGSALVKLMPVATLRTVRWTPWGRFDAIRTEFDRAIVALIEKAEADPAFEARTDLLARLLRHRSADESTLSRQDICDELVTLVGAGHETTAAALSWSIERLRRHPDVLARLVDEIDEGGSALRRATILEVLRTRPIIDLPGRRVASKQFDIGTWRIPHNHNVFVSVADLHEHPEIFDRPEAFDPYRFCGSDSPAPPWLGFGNGVRRCLGADLALFEIDIVLRTVLQNFRIHTDSAPDEAAHFRGVAFAPRRGGRVAVTRRTWPRP